MNIKSFPGNPLPYSWGTQKIITKKYKLNNSLAFKEYALSIACRLVAYMFVNRKLKINFPTPY